MGRRRAGFRCLAFLFLGRTGLRACVGRRNRSGAQANNLAFEPSDPAKSFTLILPACVAAPARMDRPDESAHPEPRG
jgi:hypothetical protein